MPAWIDGRPVNDDDAIRATGQLLGRARSPLVAGLAADVEAIRAALDLASRLGACVDAVGSDGLHAELSVLSSGGMMATTWSEARARGDCLLILGEGPGRSPLLEALLDGEPDRGGATGRTLFALGGPPSAKVPNHIPVRTGGLPIALSSLRARLAGRIAPAKAPDELSDLAQALAGARFGVIVHDPGELGDLALDMLQGLVRDLNQVTRCSSLALSRDNAGRAALSLAAWTTAFAPRLSFARGEAEHDAWQFDATRLMASGECDAALWLAALSGDPAPWLRHRPAAALLGTPTGSEAGIVIEVAVPGMTADGAIWDERVGTILHREGKISSALPRAASVIAAIAACALSERGEPAC
jgi:formylmethanofuran dehydrogenase subunit B